MQKTPHFIYHLQHIENAFETQLASLVALQLKRRHFQVNAVYPKLISIPWVELKANRIWGQLKESLRDFPNSGQIRENFFHIVSYFLGFFCMADSSFSTSRKARGPYYRILTQTEIRTLLRSQLYCWWHKVWQSCRKWSGCRRGNTKYIDT